MNITKDNLTQFSIMLCGLAVLYIILQNFASFLRPFSIALLFTFLTIGFFRLELKEKLVKLSYFSGFLALIIVLFFSASYLNVIGEKQINEAKQLNQDVSVQQNVSQPNLEDIFKNSELSSFVSFEKLTEFSQKLLQIVLSSVSAFVSELFLVILFWAFILPSYDSTLNYLQRTYFKKDKKEFKDAISEIEQGIKSYLGIKTLISLGTGLLSGVVLLLFGAPNVIMISVLIFALNFIPTVGSFVAVAIALGLFAVEGGFSLSLVALGGLLILVQVLFGNVIEPKIAGKGLNMSPLLVMFALLFWGALWGVGGMLISVPLTHAIKTAIEALSKINLKD